jgi:hypothetical protein
MLINIAPDQNESLPDAEVHLINLSSVTRTLLLRDSTARIDPNLNASSGFRNIARQDPMARSSKFFPLRLCGRKFSHFVIAYRSKSRSNPQYSLPTTSEKPSPISENREKLAARLS